MRVSSKAQKVRIAQTEFAVAAAEFQMEHDLTNVEMLQALVGAQGTMLKYMLRAERHPDDPDKGADEA